MIEPKQLSAEELKEMAYYAEVEEHEPSLKLLAHIAFLEGVIEEAHTLAKFSLQYEMVSSNQMYTRDAKSFPKLAAWLQQNSSKDEAKG